MAAERQRQVLGVLAREEVLDLVALGGHPRVGLRRQRRCTRDPARAHRAAAFTFPLSLARLN